MTFWWFSLDIVAVLYVHKYFLNFPWRNCHLLFFLTLDLYTIKPIMDFKADLGKIHLVIKTKKC